MDDNTQYDFGSPDNQNENNNDLINNTVEETTGQTQMNYESSHPNIPQDDAPIVVFVGPPQSGKSMILKCLADYLYNVEENCVIQANRELFGTDEKYQADCDAFEKILGDRNIQMSNTVDFLLVDLVEKNGGKTLAHFLEAPGEDYFSFKDPDNEPQKGFPGYLNSIAETNTKKRKNKRKVVYVILLDYYKDSPFRRNPRLKEKYIQKMENFYDDKIKNHHAEVILLYNKADLAGAIPNKWANSGGVSNQQEILKEAKTQYKKLFFKEKFLFWSIDVVQFLPFCSGLYAGEHQYNAPDVSYPEALWKAIKKSW